MATNNTSHHYLMCSIALHHSQAVSFYMHAPGNVPRAHSLSSIDEGPEVRRTLRVAPEQCFFRCLEALDGAYDEIICLVDCDLKVLMFVVENCDSEV